MNNKRPIANTIAILWFIWGLFHIIPGILNMMATIEEELTLIQELEPTTNPQILTATFPIDSSALLAIQGQQAFNLFWFGLIAFACAIAISWRQNTTAMLIVALIGGFANLGELFFIDTIGGYGTVLNRGVTAMAFTAMALSLYFYRRLIHGGFESEDDPDSDQFDMLDDDDDDEPAYGRTRPTSYRRPNQK